MSRPSIVQLYSSSASTSLEQTGKVIPSHGSRASLLAGGDWQNSGLVFTTPIGTALDDRNVRREFKAILADAKLPDIRIHDLRHTYATLLLVQGVHPRTVMETLGHSQISLTMDTYSHVLPTLTKDAAQKMDAILTGRKVGMN